MSQMSIFEIDYKPKAAAPETTNELNKLKQQAKQLLEAKEFENLSRFIYDSGIDHYKKVAEYIDSLLPEEHYYEAILRRVNKYKHKFGEEVICTKFVKNFKAEIVERRAFCWYVVKNLEDGLNYWAEEYCLKKVG